MRKVLLAAALALSLAGCANLQNAWDTVTGARVSPQGVYVAMNVFDGFERTATNYFVLCHQHPQNVTCSKTAEVQIAAAVRSGRVARNNLRAYMVAHPDAIGAQGVYDAFTAATDTLKAALQNYGVQS
jgi:opacity protein-like surface antigen